MLVHKTSTVYVTITQPYNFNTDTKQFYEHQAGSGEADEED